ncbi:uncharacterized protein LOC121862264 [Homarus americanus]|uniref:uncharacterized protein LOC121862264 n=1 Tax=Homarus americanus TaxID=6706 RepID=UPI001C48C8C0|nr:uncharacterized protein LOC121862264 [Homarus americanus]
MAVMIACCCCFSTKTGSIAVGVICLAVAFCASVGFCFALLNAEDVNNRLASMYHSYEVALDANMTEPRLQLVESLIGVQAIIDNMKTVFIVGLVFYAIYTFASLFLTYGSCTSLRSLLLPWIVLEMVPFALQVAGIVILFVYGKDDPTLSRGGVYIIAGLINIICFVIHVYWWMCPVAHYQSLKEEETVVEALVPPSHPMYPAVLLKY